MLLLTEKMYHELVECAQFETPLGPMLGCATGEGVCLLEFIPREGMEEELELFRGKMSSRISSPHLKELNKELDGYFSGELQTFSVALVTSGTSFQQAAWRQLQAIPYGTTCSYREQAGAIGRPKAFRAVAQANHRNRISIVIPCHRVIGSDGKLTGYGGGLWRKEWLLEHEKKFRQAR